jgi:hypothetical protein
MIAINVKRADVAAQTITLKQNKSLVAEALDRKFASAAELNREASWLRR